MHISKKYIFTILAMLLYSGIFLASYSHIKQASIIPSIFPILAISWYFGITPGILGTIAINLVSYLIIGWVDSPATALQLYLQSDSIVGIIIFCLIAALTGKLKDVIEEVKKARKADVDYAHLLLSLLNSIRTGVVMINSETRIIEFINHEAAQLLGRKIDELINTPCNQLICGNPNHKCPILDLGIVIDKVECKLVKPDNSTAIVLTSVSNFDLNHKHYLLHSLTDISELKQAESELYLAKQLLQQTLNNLDVAVLRVACQSKIIKDCSKATEKILGYPSEELIGKNLEILFENEKAYQAYLTQQSSCQPYTASRIHEVTLKHQKGTPQTCEITTTYLKQHAAAGQDCLFVIRDITDKKRMELENMQNQKMSSIGQLASGIAHEMNTPVQFIGDNNNFLTSSFSDLQQLLELILTSLTTLPAPEKAMETLTTLQKAVQETDLDYLLEEIPQTLLQTQEGIARISTIVRAMKEFAHPEAKEMTATNLNKIIENTVVVSKNEWKYEADLKTELDPSIPPVLCQPGELGQVFLNLIVNAAHAIAQKRQESKGDMGTILIRTAALENTVEISIADTGAGIPEDIRNKIFDPFFTTKEVGKGTGQGLAIAHNIIYEKHRGKILVESEVNRGTTFRIQLPK